MERHNTDKYFFIHFVLYQVGQVQVTSSDSLDFSTEEAVPGLMWLPIGLKDVASGNPWVTMCLIDYKHYQVDQRDVYIP